MFDPLFGFVFFGLFSPGPNVILLTTSGARFGIGATMPHLAGVVFGVGITAGLTGLGLGALLIAAPGLERSLRFAAAVWMFVMAWRLWGAKPRDAQTGERPMTLIEAVMFQWINPKVWAVALAAASAYPGGLAPWGEALRLAGAFSGINLFVCLFWASAGALLVFLLRSPVAWALFNRAMSAALACYGLLLIF